MWIQTPLDCLNQLKREHNFTADDIEEIFVSPTYMERVKFSWDGYASCRDAQFSIPYCLAAYMLRGDPGPGWYDSSRLNDKELLNLASKVKSDPDKVQNLWVAFNMFQNGSFPTTTMRITLKDGKQVEITLKSQAFGLYNVEGEFLVEKGEYAVYVGMQQPDARSATLTGRETVCLKVMAEETFRI